MGPQVVLARPPTQPSLAFHTDVVMFSSNPYAATSQDQARLPPLQPTTDPINDAYTHGAPVWLTGMKVSVYCNRLVLMLRSILQEAAKEYDLRHFQAKLKQGHLVSLSRPTQR